MASKKYVKHFFKVICLHSVQPPFCWGVGSPTKVFEGGCWKRGGDFFEQREAGIAVFT